MTTSKYAAAFDAAMKAAKARGISAVTVGAATGLRSGSALVHQWRTGKRPMPADQAPIMGRLLDIDPSIISEAYERVALSQTDASLVAGSDVLSGRNQILNRDTGHDGFVTFGFAPSHRLPGSPSSIELPRQFLAERPSLLSPGIDVAINEGDAMRGEIDSGSIVFIDTRVTEVRAEGVYAFMWVKRPMIKRIQIIAEDGIRLRGTDKLDAVDVYGPEMAALEIIGQVKGVLSLKTI